MTRLWCGLGQYRLYPFRTRISFFWNFAIILWWRLWFSWVSGDGAQFIALKSITALLRRFPTTDLIKISWLQFESFNSIKFHYLQWTMNNFDTWIKCVFLKIWFRQKNKKKNQKDFSYNIMRWSRSTAKLSMEFLVIHYVSFYRRYALLRTSRHTYI